MIIVADGKSYTEDRLCVRERFEHLVVRMQRTNSCSNGPEYQYRTSKSVRELCTAYNTVVHFLLLVHPVLRTKW